MVNGHNDSEPKICKWWPANSSRNLNQNKPLFLFVTKTFGTAALIKDLCDLLCNAVDRCATIGNAAIQFVNMSPEL